MKLILFLLLIIPLLVYPQGNLGKFPGLPSLSEGGEVSVASSQELDLLPPTAPILEVDTLGVDSTKLALDFSGGSGIDSFFVRWDTTAYPSSKTAGDSLLTGVIGDTVNLIKWGYDLAYSSKTVYVRCFVQDTIPNITYGQDSQVDIVPPDTFLTITHGQYHNIDTLIFTPADVSARDRYRLKIDYDLREDTTNTASPVLPEYITFDDLVSNPDSSYALGLNFSYLDQGDTVDTIDYEITLYDSIGNSIIQSFVSEVNCKSESACALDTFYLSGDTLYYTLLPSKFANNNGLATIKVVFSINIYKIGEVDPVDSEVWSWTLALLDSTYNVKIPGLQNSDSLYAKEVVLLSLGERSISSSYLSEFYSISDTIVFIAEEQDAEFNYKLNFVLQ